MPEAIQNPTTNNTLQLSVQRKRKIAENTYEISFRLGKREYPFYLYRAFRTPNRGEHKKRIADIGQSVFYIAGPPQMVTGDKEHPGHHYFRKL